jgi:DNA-binding NtrC family response regulator
MTMYDRTVLFVDDDEIFLQLLQIHLRDEAYVKHFATSGVEALDILQREEVHVIIADVVMPRIGGIELLKIVKREYPDVVGMIMSSYAQPMDIITAMYKRGLYRYVAKPWQLGEDFAATVREAVDHYDLISKCKDTCEHSKRCPDIGSVAE